MKTCAYCGKQIRDNAKFCMACGARQPDPPAAPFPSGAAGGNGSSYTYGKLPGAGAPQDSPPQKKKGGKARGCLGKVIYFVVSVIVFTAAYTGIDTLIENHNEKAEQKRKEETVEYVQDLVQANLDLLCLGTYDEEFLETTNTSTEEADAIIQNQLDSEVDSLASVLDIEFLTDDLRAELKDLVAEIFSHAKYEVGSGSYGVYACSVNVTVYPMDLFSRLKDAVDAGAMNQIVEKYASMDGMSEALYQAFDREWAEAMIDLIRDLLPEVDYAAPQNLTMSVSPDPDMDDRWIVTDESINDFGSQLFVPIDSGGEDDAAA